MILDVFLLRKQCIFRGPTKFLESMVPVSQRNIANSVWLLATNKTIWNIEQCSTIIGLSAQNVHAKQNVNKSLCLYVIHISPFPACLHDIFLYVYLKKKCHFEYLWKSLKATWTLLEHQFLPIICPPISSWNSKGTTQFQTSFQTSSKHGQKWGDFQRWYKNDSL